MLTHNKKQLDDTQNSLDKRGKSIQLVGISDLNYPFNFEDSNQKRQVAANFELSVFLPSSQKGTHMSRFIEVLNKNEQTIFNANNFENLAQQIATELESEKAKIKIDFTWFIKKTAPMSKVQSFLDYQVSLVACFDSTKIKKQISIKVPVKSLCPCSKSISDYGAHNQRSYIWVSIEPNKNIQLSQIITAIEKNSSSELFSILKRVDEKYITEYAYDHPLFVEDSVRDIAIELDKTDGVQQYQIHSENIESIHNHSAFAILKSEGFQPI